MKSLVKTQSEGEPVSSTIRRVSARRRSRVVWVIARVLARRGKEKELKSLLRRMVAPTHSERGCLIYDLYEAENPGTFFFYELWASRKDLIRHAASSHFTRLLKTLPQFAAGTIEVTLLNKINVTHQP
jgi:quinol monooxygenase YgiN